MAHRASLKRINGSLRLRARLVTSTEEDWLRAGRIMARYRARFGHIKPAAHISDLLILLAAARLDAEIATENAEHFRLWSRFLPSERHAPLVVPHRGDHLNA